MKYRTLIFSVLVGFISSLHGEGFSFYQEKKQELEVVPKNSILIRVANTPITVLYVKKEMDIVFARQFTEYLDDPAAKYQFYSINWKTFLKDCIDKELVLADVQESKMEVERKDIQREMQQQYGPNVIRTLHEAGIDYQDAWENIKTDIAMRRMLFVRVNRSAEEKVTPKEIRASYNEYLNQYDANDTWIYRVISVRDENTETAKKAGKLIAEKLQSGTLTLDELPVELYNDTQILPSTKVTISEEYNHSSKELSEIYKETLEFMQPKSFSPSVVHTSRKGNSKVVRIFFLKERTLDEPKEFKEIAIGLKNRLTQIAMNEQTELYLKKLRKKFSLDEKGLQELLDGDLEPFTLRNVAD